MSTRSPRRLRKVLPEAFRIAGRFAPLLRRQRGTIVMACAALLAGIVLRLLEPWPLKFVFDHVLQSRTWRGGRLPDLAFLHALPPKTILLISAAAVVVIIGSRAFADYLSTVLFAVIGNRVMTRVRNDTFVHLQRLPLSFHTRARSGDLILRVIGDVNQMRDAVVTAVLPLAANVLVLAGMWGVMFWLHWRLALLALAVTPLMWLRTVRLGRRIRDAGRAQRQRQGAMASTASESIGAIKVVQALSLEAPIAREFGDRNVDAQRQDVKTAKLAARLERGVDVLVALATAGVLYYGTVLVLNKTMSPGELLVFLAYLRKAFNPAQDLAKYTARLAKATAAGERVIELLDHAPQVRDDPAAVPAPRLRGEVAFDDVTFGYEPGQCALRNFSFKAAAGQRVALAGPSGAGKSTVVNLLLRLYDPGAGRILLDGRDARAFTVDSLRAQVSVVLQETILFASSVHDNIACGAPGGATREQVEAAARVADAHGFILELPQGYDTVLGERGATLSGGQRQRIAIARAAVRDATLVVLDEPTVGLDERSERDVIAALERLGRGRTTLIITHDLRLVAGADLILYIDDKRVLEAGTHEELMSAGGRYAEMVRLQFTDHDRTPADAVELRETTMRP